MYTLFGSILMSGVKSGVVLAMSVSAAQMWWTKLVVSGWLNVSAGVSVLVRVNRERTKCDPQLTAVGFMMCMNPYVWSIQSL
jgi:hypothetical protein